MQREHLTLDIAYDVRKGTAEFSGNVERKYWGGLIYEFLKKQAEVGLDSCLPNERDVYHIRLQWLPNNKDIRVKDDTGNRELRDGILMVVLGLIEESD